jgi:hypothetical protein
MRFGSEAGVVQKYGVVCAIVQQSCILHSPLIAQVLN